MFDTIQITLLFFTFAKKMRIIDDNIDISKDAIMNLITSSKNFRRYLYLLLRFIIDQILLRFIDITFQFENWKLDVDLKFWRNFEFVKWIIRISKSCLKFWWSVENYLLKIFWKNMFYILYGLKYIIYT